MLKKIRENRYVRNNIYKSIEEIDGELRRIRKRSSVLAICPSVTGYNWVGVNLATKNIFNNAVFEIPQYYSHCIYSEKEILIIVEVICSCGFDQVIFSGFPVYFDVLVRELKKKAHSTNIGVLYYGYLSDLAGNIRMNEQLVKIISLMKEGVLDKVGFNKKGLPETLESLTGFKSSYIVINNPNVGFLPEKKAYIGLHIGVMGNNSFRKNIHNQVGGALGVSDSKVHVIDDSEFEYFQNQDRIISHGFISDHTEYLNVLASMNVNLYVSFSESWGLVTTDSLSMGVPCVVSSSGNVYDWDEELKKHLVVEDYDNSFEIQKKIEFLLQEKPFDSERLKSYALKLNEIANDSIKNYLAL